MAVSSSTTSIPLYPDSTAPTSPNDFYLCHPYYGEGLSTLQCGMAAEALPSSPNPQTYFLREMGHTHSLPMTIAYGDCRVSVEAAGATLPSTIRMIPKHLQGLAGWVINRCVVHADGLGGFTTFGFSELMDFLLNPRSDLQEGYPRDTSFFTVTVSGLSNTPIQAGNLDPAIPIALAKALYLRQVQSPPGRLQSRFGELAYAFHVKGMTMQRGATTPWWDVTETSDEMTYECDAKLGNPSAIDCSQLSSQLGAPSDSVLVAPGAIKFLSSNTCHAAISASVALQLTWKQIQTALDTFSNFCNYAPGQASQGGRAFFGPQGATINGRKRKKKRGAAISGLNSLPPHANLTVGLADPLSTLFHHIV